MIAKLLTLIIALTRVLRRYLHSVWYTPLNIVFLSSYNVPANRAKGIKGVITILGKGSLEIGPGFRANSGVNYNSIGGDKQLVFSISEGATLRIGCNCGISNSTIVCRTSINIGDDVLIGGNVKIYDTDFHSLNYRDRKNKEKDNEGTVTKPVVINDNVFIGAHSILMKGTSIGPRAIIAAGSVVSGSIPENEIWGGNPARYIRDVD